MVHIIQLKLTETKSTKIIIGNNFRKYLFSYIRKVQPTQAVYITDALLYPFLQKNIRKGSENVFRLPVGESEKNFANFEKLLRFFYEKNIDKKSLIIAFGGGMVSDITGFAASVYYRGVPIIYIPTTLLSQVDAAIGGKNTVNFQGSKNIIGTVYLPKLILIDPTLLSSLPKKEFASGIAEIIKCAAGFDKKLFALLEKMTDDHKGLLELIDRAVEIKIKFVETDFYELRKKRWLLNLGHSLGHALESQYQLGLSHGEAVSIGLLFSLFISFLKGNIQKEEFDYVINIFRKYGLPPQVKFSLSETMQKMRYDKKSFHDGINFILIKNLGKSYICFMQFEEIQSWLEKFQLFYYSL